jgi:hypothetical protein
MTFLPGAREVLVEFTGNPWMLQRVIWRETSGNRFLAKFGDHVLRSFRYGVILGERYFTVIF